MEKAQPLFVYGNWSAYDELSDGIELTERLAMAQFSHLLRMRDQGVRFDAYLMDAFWYSPNGGYREWRRPHWPDGPDRWLLACQESGILPGLWFTVNTLCQLQPAKAWRDSVDAKGWGMSLAEGGFLEDFASVLEYWYERGIRLFKFDFAEFNAVPAWFKEETPPSEIRQRNIQCFRGMARRFRSKYPDAVLMAFNGFEEKECMDRTDRKLQWCIARRWLEVFDSIYCGDPRPADVPDVDFWRSVDLYSDHMTRMFDKSGIPLDWIDNCGFMAGPTGTCYWRGKAGWKRMLLLSLARGGRIHVAYGDLSQFSDEDARWWAAAQALYAPSMVPGGTRTWGGTPGKTENYGWVSTRGEGWIVTLVNPGAVPSSALLDVAGELRVAAYEPGFEPRVERDRVSLGPGQLAILTQGEVEVTFSLSTEERPNSSAVLEASRFQEFEEGAVFWFGPVDVESASLIVWQESASGEAIRNYPSDDRDWAFQAEFRLDQEVVATQSFPPRKVWSGMSWACFPLPSTVVGREFSVLVRSAATSSVVLSAHVRLTTSPSVLGPDPP